MLTLYDAARCPYCARVRIVLAEKRIDYEVVEIDLDDRPPWIYAKNPAGKVPVIEEDALVLPESAVIMEYLDERYPEPRLLPRDPRDRALSRLLIERFDEFGDEYYALKHGEGAARERLEARLSDLESELEEWPYLGGLAFGLADIAYVPWVLRARESLGVDLAAFPGLARWVERLAERPSVAAEAELVAALAR